MIETTNALGQYRRMLEMQIDQAKLTQLDLEVSIEKEQKTISELHGALEVEYAKHSQFIVLGSGCHASHIRYLALTNQLIEQKKSYVSELKASLVETRKVLTLLNAKERIVKERVDAAQSMVLREQEKKWDQMCGEIAAINHRRYLV